MATLDEIAEVRQNTAEPTDKIWGDDAIGELIDSLGVFGASATIWRKKASSYAEFVNVSEAGASHAFSDLHKNALTMEKKYADLAAAEAESTGSVGRVKIGDIERALRD